jgi:F0F1-type ATP synthase gamma subunit
MTAMDKANAEELLKNLKINYNLCARQAAIYN